MNKDFRRHLMGRAPVPWSVVFVTFFAAINAGCGGPGLAPVEGKVTLNNKPLANATVTLSPVRATSPGPYVGTTDNEGRFSLGPVNNEGAGVAPGEYNLMITTVKAPPGGMEDSPLPTQREIVPPEYHTGQKRFEVPDNGTKDANFAITIP